MIEVVVSDLSRVLLLPKDPNYRGSLNSLNNKLLANNTDYDFWEYFKLNQELLDYYKILGQRMPVFIFTSETIQEHPSLKPILEATFSGIFSAQTLGTDKTQPTAYKQVINQINCEPGNVIYVDDTAENIVAAAQIGLKTVLYASSKSTIDAINTELNIID